MSHEQPDVLAGKKWHKKQKRKLFAKCSEEWKLHKCEIMAEI